MSCGQNKLSGGGSAGELTDVEIYPRPRVGQISRGRCSNFKISTCAGSHQ